MAIAFDNSAICWLVHGAANTGGAAAPSTNRTDRRSGTVSNSPFASGGIVAGDSNGTVGTGSQGTVFTAANTFFGIELISIAPFGAGSTHNLTLLGAGT